MRLYARILSYLGPYGGLLVAAALATAAFAALDAFSLAACVDNYANVFPGLRRLALSADLPQAGAWPRHSG